MTCPRRRNSSFAFAGVSQQAERRRFNLFSKSVKFESTETKLVRNKSLMLLFSTGKHRLRLGIKQNEKHKQTSLFSCCIFTPYVFTELYCTKTIICFYLYPD